MTRPLTRAGLALLAVVLNCAPAIWSGDRGALVAPGFSLSPAQVESADEPYFHAQFVNPDSPLPMSHVASMCELPEGRLVTMWYAGSREGARDVALYLTARAPGDLNWSEPQPIMTRETARRDLNRPIKKIGNALVFSDGSGTLRLIYVTVSMGGWSCSSLNLSRSMDGGRTWERSRRLTLSPFFNMSELVKNGPAQLVEGGWAVPIYHELAGKFSELLWLRDGVNGTRALKSRINGGRSAFQPAVVPLATNVALAFQRDCSPAGRIVMARSDDSGRSWESQGPLELPNPDAGLDAVRLADGRLLLTFNDVAVGRSNLRLAVSADEGRTWTRAATVDEESGAEFSYPFLLVGRDGLVHLVYTWKRRAIKHVAFNLAWLDARLAESNQ